MSLNEWVKIGWLRAHEPTAVEIRDLLAVAERDLKDAKSADLSNDWRFGIAYNAALQLARAALFSAGFETPKGDSHHFRAIDSLQFTIGADASFVTLFQTLRKKRVQGVYEVAGMISEADAAEMLAVARELRQKVRAYLKREHPPLFKP